MSEGKKGDDTRDKNMTSVDSKDIRINEPDDAITDVSLRVCKVLDNISQTQCSNTYSVQLASLIVNGLYSGFDGSADVEFQLVGSVGEGCPIISSSKLSDHDLMYVMNTCQAYEHSVVCVPKPHWQFYIEQCDINPCYVRLRALTRGSSPKLFNNLPGIFSFESKLGGHYLSNAIPATMNNLFALPTFEFLKEEKIVAGPSLTHTVTGLSPYNTVDTVISIRCHAWPAVAEEWINRRRYYHWPFRCFIEEHVKHGCHVVPVGCKECEHTYLDWRLSFVLVEQALVSEFNATQLKCYLLLKHLKKFTFEDEIDYMISSYILKTTLFWVIEESPPDLWVPRRLLTAVQICLDRLITAIRTDFCPNYFIRNSNLFARRYKVVE
ncbi:uncharacterized protein [Argopecten irradians]|uniref:uncharacterized protein n=1 Tax=Argopecten irradians TaxID=31199 RepID=UPI00371FE84C